MVGGTRLIHRYYAKQQFIVDEEHPYDRLYYKFSFS